MTDLPRITLTDETTVLIGPGLLIVELSALDERDDLGIGQGVEVRQGADRFPGTVADITEEQVPPFRVFIHIKTANPIEIFAAQFDVEPEDVDEDHVTSACPTCGQLATRRTYDIGSGRELSCANCEWCWGADGQDLKPLTYREITERMGFDPMSRLISEREQRARREKHQ